MERTTLELLDAWHKGDKDALLELVRRHSPWLRTHVRRKMTDKMRVFETSEDVVQNVLLKLLKYEPRFTPRDEVDFRALIARMVVNKLQDLGDYGDADMRDPDREQRITSTTSRIGIGTGSKDRPDRGLEAEDEAIERNWVRLGLRVVKPADRLVIHLHDFERKTFAEIGSELGIEEDTARFRYKRALDRLGAQVVRLKLGHLKDLEDDLDAAGAVTA